jgi:hypothetical protein
MSAFGFWNARSHWVGSFLAIYRCETVYQAEVQSLGYFTSDFADGILDIKCFYVIRIGIKISGNNHALTLTKHQVLSALMRIL